jgi:hypothetical protein
MESESASRTALRVAKSSTPRIRNQRDVAQSGVGEEEQWMIESAYWSRSLAPPSTPLSRDWLPQRTSIER